MDFEEMTRRFLADATAIFKSNNRHRHSLLVDSIDESIVSDSKGCKVFCLLILQFIKAENDQNVRYNLSKLCCDLFDRNQLFRFWMVQTMARFIETTIGVLEKDTLVSTDLHIQTKSLVCQKVTEWTKIYKDEFPELELSNEHISKYCKEFCDQTTTVEQIDERLRLSRFIPITELEELTEKAQWLIDVAYPSFDEEDEDGFCEVIFQEDEPMSLEERFRLYGLHPTQFVRVEIDSLEPDPGLKEPMKDVFTLLYSQYRRTFDLANGRVKQKSIIDSLENANDTIERLINLMPELKDIKIKIDKRENEQWKLIKTIEKHESKVKRDNKKVVPEKQGDQPDKCTC
ncbi:hypothetical protein ACOME3_004945 [Neoechinorhynchus agilis]